MTTGRRTVSNLLRSADLFATRPWALPVLVALDRCPDKAPKDKNKAKARQRAHRKAQTATRRHKTPTEGVFASHGPTGGFPNQPRPFQALVLAALAPAA